MEKTRGTETLETVSNQTNAEEKLGVKKERNKWLPLRAAEHTVTLAIDLSFYFSELSAEAKTRSFKW